MPRAIQPFDFDGPEAKYVHGYFEKKFRAAYEKNENMTAVFGFFHGGGADFLAAEKQFKLIATDDEGALPVSLGEWCSRFLSSVGVKTLRNAMRQNNHLVKKKALEDGVGYRDLCKAAKDEGVSPAEMLEKVMREWKKSKKTQ